MGYNEDRDPFEGAEKVPSVSFKDSPIGTVVTMKVTKKAELVQTRDFDTNEPATWPDGNPKLAAVIVGEVDGEERSFWATKPSSMFSAIAEAQKVAGARIAPGGVLKVKFDAEKPNPDKKKSAQKLYKAIYTPPVEDAFADTSSSPATSSTTTQNLAAAFAGSDDEPPF